MHAVYQKLGNVSEMGKLLERQIIANSQKTETIKISTNWLMVNKIWIGYIIENYPTIN